MRLMRYIQKSNPDSGKVRDPHEVRLNDGIAQSGRKCLGGTRINPNGECCCRYPLREADLAASTDCCILFPTIAAPMAFDLFPKRLSVTAFYKA